MVATFPAWAIAARGPLPRNWRREWRPDSGYLVVNSDHDLQSFNAELRRQADTVLDGLLDPPTTGSETVAVDLTVVDLARTR